jgi:hypothetical protein
MTMDRKQHLVLKAELKKPEYATMSYGEMAEAINAQTQHRRKNVEYRDAASYLMLRDLYLEIKLASESETDLVKAKLYDTLTKLVEDGLIPDPDREAILALTDDLTSIAHELNLPQPVKDYHCENALNFRE